MTEAPRPNTSAVPEVQARLQEIARILRQPGAINPESQRALTALVEELSNTLATTALPPEAVTHLAESTAHLAEALQQQKLPVTLRDRLARAALNAEAQAPTAAGLAHRLLEALANIGI